MRVKGGRAAALAVAGIVAAFGTADVVAQEVRFRPGAGGVPLADQILRTTLAQGAYRVIAHDTLIAADQVVPGDLILLGATLRLEGRIDGNLLGVQSDIFARPGAGVSGSVVVMAGGFYGSSLARLGAPPVDASTRDYRVEERPDGLYVITAPGSRADLRLSGLYGFLFPDYDRVNAVTLRWGFEYSPGARPLVPHVRARLLYHTARTNAGGEVEVWWPFGRHAVVLRGGRVTRSNDTWTQGDVENSVASLLAAVDTRSYYDARFAEADLHLEYGIGTRWGVALGSAWEQSRSLANEDPFSVFSVRGGFRPNTPVAEVDLVTGKLGLSFEVGSGGGSRLELGGTVEGADRDLLSDLSFVLGSGRLRARLGAGRAGSFDVRGRAQVPLSDAAAPPQRWRALGGWGSLPTLVPLERQGDRMWWVQVNYHLPLAARVGYLGRLRPWVRYAAGNAWVRAVGRPAEVHNVGLGVYLGRLEAGIFVAPEADFEAVLTLGFNGG